MAIDGPEIVELDEKGNVIDIDEGRQRRGRIADDTDPEFSDEMKEELRDLGVRESAIRDGGDYRQNELRKIYWFPLDALLEFEQADVATQGDDNAFWTEVENIILKHGLQTKAERTQTKQKSWRDWLPGSGGLSNWGSNNKISKWWTDYDYSYGQKVGSGSELTRKLVVALRAITTTVSVVNDTGKRYRVELADDQGNLPTSYTDFNSQLVVVSPSALLDTSIDRDFAIEVTSGYGLHEASHIKYSEPIKDALTEPSVLRPLMVSSLLFNLIEDERIESLTSRKFPGFAQFFVTAKKYLWDTAAKNRPDRWGPGIEEKLNSVIAMVKWPDEYKPVCDADKDLAAELPWWQNWLADYMEERAGIRESLERGIERLRTDKNTAKEMDKIAKDEERLEAAPPRQLSDQEFNDLLKRIKDKLGKDVTDPCPSPGSPRSGQQIQLTEIQANQIDQLLREEFSEEETSFKMWEGGPVQAGPTIGITRPEEDSRSQASYEKPGSMVERLRSVFFFRKKTPIERERLLKQGFIDEDELWRAGAGDPRVFERSFTPEENPTSVTLLIDISGSMVGRGIATAQELANVMQACLRTQRGVRVRVRAHTTGRETDCAIFRIWEPGDPDSRIGLLKTLPHGSNWDGFAIEWCLKELESTAKPDETKVLIVLSDGLPAGANSHLSYSGMEAMRHMRYVTDKYERTNDITTIQIAVDPEGLRPEDQAVMFKHWIGYESDQKLLVDMTKLLSRVFGGIE